jgi:UDP-glucose 4-epimerase
LLESEIGSAVDSYMRALDGAPWMVLWCAGAGVVATPLDALAGETEVVRGFAERLGDLLAGDAALAAAGSVFVASSAGGVYSASTASPPFNEGSETGCLAPYGLAKLEQEALWEAFALGSGADLVVGRFSNLYGPGQRLAKGQGLISVVAQAALRREPVSLYVPLDTIRDYLFAADAGRMTVDALERLEAERAAGAGQRVIMKIFASEVETTVASVLGAWRQSLRRPLRVALATNPASRLQPRVLSFRSRIWPDLRGRPTLLPLGIEAVWRDQLGRMMAHGASAA